MKRKGISPLLAAVILVALTISVAFIINATISGMVQKQAATAEETAQVSGALLQVDLNSLACSVDQDDGSTILQMALRLVGATKPAEGLSVVMKDASGKLLKYINETILITPGVNTIEINFTSAAAQGEISYLAVSTMNPPIPATYDNKTYGKIVECKTK